MRKLIYIVGCANCGSTLLTRLLARHSAIATVGELKATAISNPDEYLCGCGQPLLKCAFWQQVLALCQQQDFDFNLKNFGMHYNGGGWLDGRLIRTRIRSRAFEKLRDLMLDVYPGARATLARVAERNSKLIDAICQVQGKPLFLDGSKDPVRLKHFVQSGKFDVRAIHLVRDGRAIVASYKKSDPNIASCLELWKTKAEECELVKGILPKELMMVIRYEDLCRDLPGTLKTLCQFIGIPAESRCWEGGPIDQQHILGHHSRLASDDRVKERKDWQDLLTPGEIEVFGRVGSRLNALHGYN